MSEGKPIGTTKLIIHFIFGVNRGEIPLEKNSLIEKFAAAALQHRGQKLLKSTLLTDHWHLLIEHIPNMSLEQIASEIKTHLALFIAQHHTEGFSWREGYIALSYGQSQMEQLVNFFEKQSSFHENTSFEDECKTLLEKFGLSAQECIMLKD